MPLPSLSIRSQGSSPQLQALTPVPMVPEWVSQRGQVAARLLNIEFVNVKSVLDRRGDRSYVVEIYEAATSKNRIPTNRTSPVSLDASRKPTARIKRYFSAFAALRSDAYSHAHDAHNLVPCAFCKGVIDEIVWGDNQPGGLLKLLANEDKVVRKLAKSVNAFLELVKSNNGDGRLCSGQESVPQVLYDFLFHDDESESTR